MQRTNASVVMNKLRKIILLICFLLIYSFYYKSLGKDIGNVDNRNIIDFVKHIIDLPATQNFKKPIIKRFTILKSTSKKDKINGEISFEHLFIIKEGDNILDTINIKRTIKYIVKPHSSVRIGVLFKILPNKFGSYKISYEVQLTTFGEEVEP